MTTHRPCPPTPGPLEDYAQQFDPLVSSLAQHRGQRDYSQDLPLPRDHHKTLTRLAGAESITRAQRRQVQQLQRFMSESSWNRAQISHRRIAPLQADPATAPHSRGPLMMDATAGREDCAQTAQVGRQNPGSIGKIDNGIVAVTSVWADLPCYCPLHVMPCTPASRLPTDERDPGSAPVPPAVTNELPLVKPGQAQGAQQPLPGRTRAGAGCFSGHLCLWNAPPTQGIFTALMIARRHFPMDQPSQDFLGRYKIAVLSSVVDDGTPQVCTIFYVFDPTIPAIIFKSRTQSQHSLALRRQPHAAIAVYRHDSGYLQKAGIQLKGLVERVRVAADMERYVHEYSERFPGAREHFESIDRLLAHDATSTLFRFLISAYKLTDGWSDRLDLNYSTSQGSQEAGRPYDEIAAFPNV
jgi:uncharacterized protein YhbP (UPF0306 family)